MVLYRYLRRSPRWVPLLFTIMQSKSKIDQTVECLTLREWTNVEYWSLNDFLSFKAIGLSADELFAKMSVINVIYRAQYGDAMLLPFQGAPTWRPWRNGNLSSCLATKEISHPLWTCKHSYNYIIWCFKRLRNNISRGRVIFYILFSFPGRHFNVELQKITK